MKFILANTTITFITALLVFFLVTLIAEWILFHSISWQTLAKLGALVLTQLGVHWWKEN